MSRSLRSHRTAALVSGAAMMLSHVLASMPVVGQEGPQVHRHSLAFPANNGQTSGYANGRAALEYSFSACSDGRVYLYLGFDRGSVVGSNGYWYEGQLHPITGAEYPSLHEFDVAGVVVADGRQIATFSRSVNAGLQSGCFSGVDGYDLGRLADLVGQGASRDERDRFMRSLRLGAASVRATEPLRNGELEARLRQQRAAAEAAARQQAAADARAREQAAERQRAEAARAQQERAAQAQRSGTTVSGSTTGAAAERRSAQEQAEARRQAEAEAERRRQEAEAARIMADVRAQSQEVIRRGEEAERNLVGMLGAIAARNQAERKAEEEARLTREAEQRRQAEEAFEAAWHMAPTNRLPGTQYRIRHAGIYHNGGRGFVDPGVVLPLPWGSDEITPSMTLEPAPTSPVRVELRCILADSRGVRHQDEYKEWTFSSARHALLLFLNPVGGWKDGAYRIDCFAGSRAAPEKVLSVPFSVSREVAEREGRDAMELANAKRQSETESVWLHRTTPLKSGETITDTLDHRADVKVVHGHGFGKTAHGYVYEGLPGQQLVIRTRGAMAHVGPFEGADWVAPLEHRWVNAGVTNVQGYHHYEALVGPSGKIGIGISDQLGRPVGYSFSVEARTLPELGLGRETKGRFGKTALTDVNEFEQSGGRYYRKHLYLYRGRPGEFVRVRTRPDEGISTWGACEYELLNRFWAEEEDVLVVGPEGMLVIRVVSWEPLDKERGYTIKLEAARPPSRREGFFSRSQQCPVPSRSTPAPPPRPRNSPAESTADRALQRGDTAAAIAGYERALAEEGPAPEISLKLGPILVGRGEFRRALNVLTDALGANQARATEWIAYLGGQARERGDAALAETALRAAFNTEPGNTKYRLLWGHFLYTQQRWAELLPLAEQAVSEQPDHKDWAALLAQARKGPVGSEGDRALQRGDTTAAIEAWEREMQERPSAHVSVSLGALLATRGQLHRAMELLVGGYDAYPNPKTVAQNVAYVGQEARKQGDAVLAERAYRHVLATDPENLTYRYQWGYFLYTQQRWAELLPLAEQAVSEQPDHKDWAALLAQARKGPVGSEGDRALQRGDTAAAIEGYEQEIRHQPSPSVSLKLGSLLVKRGQLHRAMELLVDAYTAEPKRATEWIAYLGQEAGKHGDATLAERAIQYAIAAEPGNPQHRYIWGYFLYTQQRWAELLPLAEQAVSEQPDHKDWAALLAQARKGLAGGVRPEE